MALEVHDGGLDDVRLFRLQLGLAFLFRAEHGGHGCPRVAGVRARPSPLDTALRRALLVLGSNGLARVFSASRGASPR